MSKTIKQLADELGIDKQKVYRYVKKNHINDVHHDTGVMYIDEAVEKLIKSHFSESFVSDEVHHDAHQSASLDAVNDALIDMLRKELDAKNKQIDDLRTENKELKDKLLELSGEVGASLKALTQGQLAEKLIEGRNAMDEVAAASKKKHFFKFRRRERDV